MSYEKRKNFVVNFLYYGILTTGIVFTIKFGWKYMSPFIIAFVIAYVLKPVVDRMHIVLKLKRNLCAVLCLSMFYLVFGAIITITGFQLIVLVRNLFYSLPDYYNNEIAPIVTMWLNRIQDILVDIAPEIKTVLDEFTHTFSENLGSSITSISMSVLSRLSTVVTWVPGFLIKTLVCVIASFFIAIDYYNITYFIAKQLNEKFIYILYKTENYAKTALCQYLKSYSLIMLITFCEVGIGLTIIQVNNAFIIALIIAVFDILPVLGSGGILIPWAIISIIIDDTYMGIRLIIIYLVITVVRNIIEPKIIGDQVGLHPLATLMMMFLGARLMGVIGLISFPIIRVILKRLNDSENLINFKKLNF